MIPFPECLPVLSQNSCKPAFSDRLVLGQLKVDDKSNEITAIPQLLTVLDLHGCIVTIDAMGTQKAIAKPIVEQGGDYVLALKGNQGNLFEDVQQIFEQAQSHIFQGIEHDFYKTLESGHGRIEKRRCWSLGQVEGVIDADKWTQFASITMVESIRQCDGKTTREVRYYISSLAPDAQCLATSIRTHWSIENPLHWVLDVAFREDECRIRTGHAPENFTLLRGGFQ
jgi:predicted transposase YbfD/YdcC